MSNVKLYISRVWHFGKLTSLLIRPSTISAKPLMIETLNFVNQYTIIIDIPGRNFKWKINIVVKEIVLQVRNLGKAKV